MDAMRYNASPFTSDMLGRDAFRSSAVWCLAHSDSFEDVISTEKEVAANSGAAIASSRFLSMVANACFRIASLRSKSGKG